MITTKKLSIAECDRIITAPGQILEMEQVTVDGQVQRTWKTLPRTFREFILTSFEVYPDRIFMSSPLPLSQGVDAREHVTFRETSEKAIRTAAWMKSQSLGIGSKVAIGGGNSTGWVVSWLAIHLIGGIGIALNAWLPQDALLHCLKLTKPDMILVDEERVELFSSMKGDLAGSKIFCWSDPKSEGRDSIKSNVQEVAGISASQIQEIREGSFLNGQKLGPESEAVIFFTSGTGGRPKAVLSTQRMALSNLWSGFVAPFRAALRAGQSMPPLPKPSDPQRTVLLSVPLFHVTGNLSWLMRAIHGGSKMVYMRHWNVKEAVKLILSENVSVIGGVPAVAASLLHSTEMPKERDFATVFYGGAPPSRQLAAEVKQRWPKAAIVQGYGMTETNAYVCSVAGADYLERPESTGPPVPISDLRIVDPETKKPLFSGQSGLILVRGPQVMKCYYADEAATRETIDPGGWLDTGDAGYLDDEGFLFIKDRLKDIIIRGGENIASQDVENAFYADKRVAEAAAIGVPDERLGELVGVIVSLHPSAQASENDLLESVRPRLARHALPAIIMIHDGPLPRNVNGKLVKKELKPSLIKIWNERRAKQTRSKL